jgi:hypothetical protein
LQIGHPNNFLFGGLRNRRVTFFYISLDFRASLGRCDFGRIGLFFTFNIFFFLSNGFFAIELTITESASLSV